MILIKKSIIEQCLIIHIVNISLFKDTILYICHGKKYMTYVTSDKQERFNELLLNGAKGYAVYSDLRYMVMERKQSEFYAFLFDFIADHPKCLRPVLKYMSQTEIERYENEPYYALSTADDLCDIVIEVIMDDNK